MPITESICFGHCYASIRLLTPFKMKRPNILLIVTDQQRHDTIHAHGNPYIRTPNLDWLSEGGINFSRCYTDAPICAPARATILTGRHYRNMPEGTGMFHQPSCTDPSITMPALLTKAGYQTKAVGKLHYHPERANYGWEHAEILEDYYRYMARHPERGVPHAHGLGQNQMEPGISSVDEANSLTRWIVERGINFLETRDSTRPFCLYVGISKPHPPLDPCLAYWLLYANRKVPPPVYGDWSKDIEKIATGWFGPTWSLNGADRFSPELIEDIRRAYYALITQIDYNLGLLFARLRELGELDNTLILFTSDHGEMLGDHHMGAKTTFLEGSAHIPMIVRPPRTETGQRFGEYGGVECDSICCLADIMPTLLGAAGVDIPSKVQADGIDLADLTTGKAKRESLIGQVSEFYMLVEGPYKYLYCANGGAELLFNLEEDPQETRNLATVKKFALLAKELRTKLVAQLYKEKHKGIKGGDLVCNPAPERKAIRRNFWPGHHHPLHTPHDVMH